jgi:hypothetical protein
VDEARRELLRLPGVGPYTADTEAWAKNLGVTLRLRSGALSDPTGPEPPRPAPGGAHLAAG